jgi:DNA-binding XRE family transcriptional regulator
MTPPRVTGDEPVTEAVTGVTAYYTGDKRLANRSYFSKHLRLTNSWKVSTPYDLLLKSGGLVKANEKFALTRRRAGISQGRIARLAGTHQHNVCQYEIGNYDLKPELVAALEQALCSELENRAEKAKQLLESFVA